MFLFGGGEAIDRGGPNRHQQSAFFGSFDALESEVQHYLGDRERQIITGAPAAEGDHGNGGLQAFIRWPFGRSERHRQGDSDGQQSPLSAQDVRERLARAPLEYGELSRYGYGYLVDPIMRYHGGYIRVSQRLNLPYMSAQRWHPEVLVDQLNTRLQKQTANEGGESSVSELPFLAGAHQWVNRSADAPTRDNGQVSDGLGVVLYPNVGDVVLCPMADGYSLAQVQRLREMEGGVFVATVQRLVRDKQSGLYKPDRMDKPATRNVEELCPVRAYYIMGKQAFQVEFDSDTEERPALVAGRYTIDADLVKASGVGREVLNQRAYDEYLNDYRVLKEDLIVKAVYSGIAGFVLTDLTFDLQTALIFLIGNLFGTAYLGLLEAGTDTFGTPEAQGPLGRLSNIRLALPVLLMVTLTLYRSATEGGSFIQDNYLTWLTREQFFAGIIGFLSYRVPFILMALQSLFGGPDGQKNIPGSIGGLARINDYLSEKRRGREQPNAAQMELDARDNKRQPPPSSASSVPFFVPVAVLSGPICLGRTDVLSDLMALDDRFAMPTWVTPDIDHSPLTRSTSGRSRELEGMQAPPMPQEVLSMMQAGAAGGGGVEKVGVGEFCEGMDLMTADGKDSTGDLHTARGGAGDGDRQLVLVRRGPDGRLYGLRRKEIIDTARRGRIPLIECDPSSLFKLKGLGDDIRLVTIWVTLPSQKDMEARLRQQVFGQVPIQHETFPPPHSNRTDTASSSSHTRGAIGEGNDNSTSLASLRGVGQEFERRREEMLHEVQVGLLSGLVDYYVYNSQDSSTNAARQARDCVDNALTNT
ncbi:unnamed protein product [Vitrella brassicaformis CCMP3155]|uniref:Guanylate kinase-like domain-containing protein n=1 Tax=Vitrella brassicaformis (strain CCMP3155) TaxID=1169540 RepID=A0A0G4H5C6_VITBC|nr:unnamed protein product [Vitrella brassicaformis CCMP3155]|eukprot:CEM38990.1 unnamed protein product [Vitrella brassicaformis CCMP3155]